MKSRLAVLIASLIALAIVSFLCAYCSTRSVHAQGECPCPTRTPRPTRTSTAVQLVRFEAKDNTITWETAIEINTVGFNVLRAFALTNPYTQVNASLIPGKVLGSPESDVYTFVDESVCQETACYYKLQEVGVGGVVQEYGPVSNGIASSNVVVVRMGAAPNAGIAVLWIAAFICICGIGLTILHVLGKL